MTEDPDQIETLREFETAIEHYKRKWITLDECLGFISHKSKYGTLSYERYISLG